MNFTNTSQPNSTFEEYGDMGDEIQTVSLSPYALHIIQIINHLLLSGVICLIGIVVNIINMIIFLQQGLDNTVNISMFAIAASDLCSLVTLEWVNINLNPFMESADVPFEPAEVQYLTGGWPHACFLQITIWITVYVTTERFFCIAIPLKVKLIFTLFRTKVVIITIYFLVFLAFSPIYIALYFGENFNTAKNKTRVGLRSRNISYNLEDLVYMVSAVMGIVSFITLVIFTFLLVVTLKRRAQWRKSTLDEEKSKAMSKRDSKTMTMVGLIAFILIICSAPGMFFSVVAYIIPGFNVNDVKYGNIAHACWSFAFLSEAINATVNILFFFKMSSKFRQTFLQLFARCRLCDQGDTSVDKVRSSASRAVPSVSSDLNSPDDSTPNTSTTNSRTALHL